MAPRNRRARGTRASRTISAKPARRRRSARRSERARPCTHRSARRRRGAWPARGSERRRTAAVDQRVAHGRHLHPARLEPWPGRGFTPRQLARKRQGRSRVARACTAVYSETCSPDRMSRGAGPHVPRRGPHVPRRGTRMSRGADANHGNLHDVQIGQRYHVVRKWRGNDSLGVRRRGRSPIGARLALSCCTVGGCAYLRRELECWRACAIQPGLDLRSRDRRGLRATPPHLRVRGWPGSAALVSLHSPREILVALAGVLRGLCVLHDRDWVHGDLKPANSCSRGRDTQVIDLVWRALGRPGGGTAGYLAPELLTAAMPHRDRTSTPSVRWPSRCYAARRLSLTTRSLLERQLAGSTVRSDRGSRSRWRCTPSSR